MSENEIFHHYNEDHNTTSANTLVPYILKYVQPLSVVDIGCGLGQWLNVFKKHGIDKVVGVDGAHVPRDRRMISEFYEFDLRNIIKLKENLIESKYLNSDKFDLCMSLEVAEHLAENLAIDFVSSLTSFSDCVLFSAAIPNQTGENHFNEQPHHYWINIFKNKGFTCYDIFRKQFWNNDSVNWWYRQNMYLFVKDGYNLKKEAKKFDGNMYIHPEMLNIYTSTQSDNIEKVANKKCFYKFKNLIYKVYNKILRFIFTNA